jgi:2-polyprenyl-6-methoxyphenol hydroxylase-like FAD-dependent oxidoreductase
MKIAIIGAGIGGLTLALMAERQGFEVEVWEAVQTLRPLGVGINLLPHAARQLCELGLEDTLGALAIRTSALA